MVAASSVVSRLAPEETPRHRGSGPWWETLDPDFALVPERFVLGARDRLAVAATAASDVAIRTLGAALVGTLAMPAGYRTRKLERAIAEEDLYLDAVRAGDPDRFFRRPPSGVRMTFHRPPPPRFRAEGGRCDDLRFESPFEPVSPAERDPYLAHRRNRTAHARFWRHDGPPRPTLVAIHGFSADPYWLNEWFFDLPSFYRMGFDVLLVTLPFHGRRREYLAPFSGHGFFAGGLARMNEAFAQAAFDLRIYLDFLAREHGAPAVGVTGVSLGGYAAALLGALEPKLAFVLPNVPVVSIADLVLEWHPIGGVVRKLLAKTGRRLEDLRRFLSVHCPLTWPAVVPKERLMIIGGVGDRMASPKHARILWEHWDRPKVSWFVGSHLLHLDAAGYRGHIRAFLADLDLGLDPSPSPASAAARAAPSRSRRPGLSGGPRAR